MFQNRTGKTEVAIILSFCHLLWWEELKYTVCDRGRKTDVHTRRAAEQMVINSQPHPAMERKDLERIKIWSKSDKSRCVFLTHDISASQSQLE